MNFIPQQASEYDTYLSIPKVEVSRQAYAKELHTKYQRLCTRSTHAGQAAAFGRGMPRWKMAAYCCSARLTRRGGNGIGRQIVGEHII